MEDVLDVYQRPYDPAFPVVCMDETSKQLVREVRHGIPAAPGRTQRWDYEYERNGVANLFLASEPLAGWRCVSVTERRTKCDWARFIASLLDQRYAEADRVVLVMDNLNTHSKGSFYEAFPPHEARAYCQRLEIHHTPKHGSWLNVAECELSALQAQCIGRRVPDRSMLATETAAWTDERNAAKVGISWQFTTADARIKLRRLYPSI